MAEILLEALLSMATPTHLMFLFLGTVLGLVVGILPGLGGIAGLALEGTLYELTGSHAAAITWMTPVLILPPLVVAAMLTIVFSWRTLVTWQAVAGGAPEKTLAACLITSMLVATVLLAAYLIRRGGREPAAA